MRCVALLPTARGPGPPLKRRRPRPARRHARRAALVKTACSGRAGGPGSRAARGALGAAGAGGLAAAGRCGGRSGHRRGRRRRAQRRRLARAGGGGCPGGRGRDARHGRLHRATALHAARGVRRGAAAAPACSCPCLPGRASRALPCGSTNRACLCTINMSAALRGTACAREPLCHKPFCSAARLLPAACRRARGGRAARERGSVSARVSGRAWTTRWAAARRCGPWRRQPRRWRPACARTSAPAARPTGPTARSGCSAPLWRWRGRWRPRSRRCRARSPRTGSAPTTARRWSLRARCAPPCRRARPPAPAALRAGCKASAALQSSHL